MSHLSSLSVVAVSALLGACTGSPPSGGGATPSGKGEGFPRDSLVIATMADANNLIGVVQESAFDGQITGALSYGLLDADFDCELKYKPALAKSWKFSEDGTTIAMELRDDIQWEDGQPVTAEDIKFALDLVADPMVASPRISAIKYMKPEARPKIIDPTHIEFQFTHAFDPITMLADASIVEPLPKHVLKNADRATLRGNPYNQHPLSNGHWKLDKWDRGQSIVLVPNDKWSGPPDEMPKLRRVIFRVLPEYTSRLVELETGGVDVMDGIQIADADKLAKEHPEIKLYRQGWRFLDYVAWNEIDPEDYKKAAAAAAKAGEQVDLSKVKPNRLFADVGVRRALGQAIDYDKLIHDLLTSTVTGEKYGRRAIGTITPELCKTYNDEVTPLAYDPKAAAAALDALGWTDHDGDGIRDKDGLPMRFTLLTNSGNPRRAKAAVIIQANLKEIGVDMQIEQVESNAFFDRLRKKDFEAALAGWSAGLFTDPSTIWHSGSEYPFNFVSYNNPEVDRLMEQGLKEPDPDKANAIWKKVQADIYQDQPYAFLYWKDNIVGVHKRFQDVRVDILSPYGDLYKWWVPADQIKYEQ